MKFLRGFLSFIAFLLCIVLFVASVATMLVADVRVITSRDAQESIYNQFIQYIFGSMESPIPGVNLAGGKVILFADKEEEEENALMEKLIESVYDTLSSQFGGEVPFTQEQVSEFIKESTLPKFISEKAADIFTGIYNGEVTTTITNQEIKELIEENKSLIEETLDIKITNDIVESVVEMVEKADVNTKIQEMVSEFVGSPITPNPENPGETQAPGSSGDEGVGKPGLKPPVVDKHESEGGIVGNVTAIINNIKGLIPAIKRGDFFTVLYILNNTFTENVLIACIGVCVILMLLVFLCKLNRWYAALRNCGVVYLLAGILMLVPVGLGQLLPSMTNLLPDFLKSEANIVLIQIVLNMTTVVSGSVALGGLLFIIVGSLSGSAIRRKARKKAEKEALAAAEQKKYVAVPTAAPVPTIEDILAAAGISTEAPAQKAPADAAEEPVEQTEEETVEQTEEETAETAEEPDTEEAAETPAEEAAEASVEEPTEEPAEEIIEEEPAETAKEEPAEV